MPVKRKPPKHMTRLSLHAWVKALLADMHAISMLPGNLKKKRKRK